ncbi:transposase [Mesorhizobium neociceri]|uniref:Transposase n=1 Tax=Mesorhizobium neociceri TaxID=1307853 RepID=A0A838B831_9HYPH|nr:transposase [Mesorhizobium neociceri]MBA1142756.1 transposase [Mesorhizobium neociceri]
MPNTPGGQRRFSNLAIETVLVMGSLHKMALRQTEGFVRSVIELMRLDLTVPDHTTLSRRRRTVAVTDFRWPRKGRLTLLSTAPG